MLRSNLWTTRGLTNGATGRVVDVLAEKEEGQLPHVYAVLVEFDAYTGPAFDPNRPRMVPVPLTTTHFGKNGGKKAMSRTQIPLSLAYAMTIHKSQGQTYGKVVVCLSKEERSLGLTYVAFSRVTNLAGLLLTGDYSKDRILRLNLKPQHRTREEAEEWLDSLAGLK